VQRKSDEMIDYEDLQTIVNKARILQTHNF